MQQETESTMIDTSITGEPTTTSKRPGKKPEEYDKYIKKCNDKIYEIEQKITYWDEIAKTNDERENKEEIKRNKYTKSLLVMVKGSEKQLGVLLKNLRN